MLVLLQESEMVTVYQSMWGKGAILLKKKDMKEMIVNEQKRFELYKKLRKERIR